MIALVVASGFPTGAGTLSTIASISSRIPTPVFAETRQASVASIPIEVSISSATLSGSAAGRSILFITGTDSQKDGHSKYSWW